MAIHVEITHVSEPGSERRVLEIKALGVSGGDQKHEIAAGEKIGFWLSREGLISLRDKDGTVIR